MTMIEQATRSSEVFRGAKRVFIAMNGAPRSHASLFARARLARGMAARKASRHERSEAGDTLVEILLALVVISLGVVSLIAAFATSISASANHRSLATLDTLLKSYAETATFQIQQSSNPMFATCATPATYSAISNSFSLPVGDSAYKVPSISTIQYSSKNQTSTSWVAGSYLTTTLNAGTAATTLSVNALPAGISATDHIAVGTGAGETTFTATSAQPPSTGPTTIRVNPLLPSATLGAGSNVYDAAWSASAGCPTNSIAPQQITATASGPGGVTSSLSFVVDQPDDGQPQFQPPTTISVLGGTNFSIPVTAGGGPVPSLSAVITPQNQGGLPSSSNASWNNNPGLGTGTLTGKAPTASGSYSVATITATNGVGSPVSQVYTLVVGLPPAITSAAQVSETPGSTFSFTVTTTGSPPPSLSATGLPAGVTFVDNGAGGATLSGTAPSTLGTYPITISASNDLGTATQNFTLIVSSPPTITTASLAVANAGQNGYSQALSATGGTTPYTWSISSGVLPSGLTISGSTGVISGNVSSTATSQAFTVTVTDAGGLTGTKSFTLTVNAAPIIATSSLPGVTKTGTYSQTLAATGGTTPYTWSTSSGGALPNGLTIGSSTGTISGTASSTATTQTFTVQVTGANGADSTKSFTITVNAAPNITTTSLPAGTNSGTYSQTLGVTGGTAPLTWSLASGVLPSGLTLGSSNGTITGTITGTAVTEIFTVQVTDADGVSDTQQLTITVNGPPVIGTSSLAVATAGQTGYSQSLSATGGTTPYTWSVTGSLPTGLSLGSSTGVISGNVGSSAVTKTFTVQVKDANGVTTSQSFTLTVNPAPNITTTSLPGGTKAGTYSQTLAASFGTAPLTWSLSNGNLPNGLTLSSTGVISGTISGSATSQTFTVRVTDANGVSDTQQLTITVNGAPNITTTSLPAGTKTGTYSQTLAATGGTTPYTWSVSAGILPAGLSLSSSGVISGTLSGTAVTETFTVKVTDIDGVSDTQSLAITVNGAPTITTTSLPAATRTGTYSQTVAGTGGTTPYTWSLSSGTLPTGLSLGSTNGVVSGTVTGSSSQTFIVQLSDSNGVTATQSLTITVNAAPTITTTSLPAGTKTGAYSQNPGRHRRHHAVHLVDDGWHTADRAHAEQFWRNQWHGRY